MPKALARWIARGCHEVFCWQADDRNILVEVADHTRKGSRCLILREYGCSSRRLTAREATVLHWVGYGKTNEEIALLEQIKLCTVKKCLERMFVKLGVENRTAAASFLDNNDGN